MYKEINYNIIPKQGGTYALHLRQNHPERTKIGKLGEFCFPAGDYLYIGSALGPGGLKARLTRHLRGKSRYHWHIDWLREITDAIGAYYLTSDSHYECKWSQFLLSFPLVTIPAARFGASDCRRSKNSCAAHLVCFETGFHTNNVRDHLSKISGLKVVYRGYTANSQPD
jgi:Uri superfamily endonuclease